MFAVALDVKLFKQIYIVIPLAVSLMCPFLAQALEPTLLSKCSVLLSRTVEGFREQSINPVEVTFNLAKSDYSLWTNFLGKFIRLKLVLGLPNISGLSDVIGLKYGEIEGSIILRVEKTTRLASIFSPRILESLREAFLKARKSINEKKNLEYLVVAVRDMRGWIGFRVIEGGEDHFSNNAVVDALNAISVENRIRSYSNVDLLVLHSHRDKQPFNMMDKRAADVFANRTDFRKVYAGAFTTDFDNFDDSISFIYNSSIWDRKLPYE